ncbi:glycoside hydrolase superfamily [Gaertneriomyces semiglobifer]|nr:glycoside hydrolase superfamily [Gaertneriomyces semiglobifer]
MGWMKKIGKIANKVLEQQSSSSSGNVYPGSGTSSPSGYPAATAASHTQQSAPDVPPRPRVNAQPSDGHGQPFITRHGSTLLENGRPFKFISMNIPNLLFLEDRPCTDSRVVPDPWEQHDALSTIAQMGGRVARTYTLGVGQCYHITAARTYNEQAFVGIDYALAIARQVGVRLIIPLINNYNGKKDQIGGGDDCAFGTYGLFAGLRGKRPSQFWTDREVIEDFKHLISFLLNRVNTINGIRYGDDSTVLAWELGNELGGWEGARPPTSWTMEVTAHIRSLAPQSLVAAGAMGGLDAPKRFDKDAVSSPNGPDIYTNHYYYGESDLSRIPRDASYVAKFNKVFYIGEFGFSNTNVYGRIYDQVIRNPQISGSMIWSLRFHSMFGGFYVHKEDGNYWSYHAPGFRSRSRGFCEEEWQVVPQIRHFAYVVQGCDPASIPMPVPQAPYLLLDIKPNCLRFRGSAWAASYVIWRGVANGPSDSGVEWDQGPIATGVTDDVPSGESIWADPTAMQGIGYFYKVQAVGVQGGLSEWSNVVGPVHC